MKKYLKNTYLLYTISFLILLPIVFWSFITEGKSFIWHLDGLDQHYPILLYYGKLLRGILTGQGFPMVDFKLGLGFDTITTISYYALGDPIALLTVFMTKKNGVFFYDFLILLRFYLAGISYMILMKYWKKDGHATALGALIYVFSGFSLYACLRHPFFMNPMIYLPLLIVGVEKVLHHKKPYLMIAMVFISAVSNFYFFFILSVFTVIYIIFRYFIYYRKEYDKLLTGFIITGLRTGGYYILGVLLSAFLFLPIIYAFTQNGRLNIGPKLVTGYLNYDQKYYVSLFQGMYTTGVYPGYWTVLSFSAIMMVSFAILFCNKKFWKFHIAYIMILLGLLVPAFGYFMNGFAYVTNRWCFFLSLLVAVTFRITYDKIYHLEMKEKVVLFIELAVYGYLTFAFHSKDIVMQVFISLLFIMILILIIQTKWMKHKPNLKKFILFALIFITIGANGYVLYSPQYSSYVNAFLSANQLEKYSFKGVIGMISELPNHSFYRVDTYGDKALNESLNVGYNDVSGYYSLMNGSITSYLKDLEDLCQISAYRFQNFDHRTMLNELAGVKYMATTDCTMVPFGYKQIKHVYSGYRVYYLYQNEYALPLGYAYNNYMPKADYDKLNALEKQSAMMSNVILNENTKYVTKAKPDLPDGITKVKTKIIADPGIELNKDTINIKQKNATLTLSFTPKPNTEIYVRLGKLNIKKNKSASVCFFAKSSYGVNRKVNVRNIYFNSYFGKENYLVNTGYCSFGTDKVVITFPKKQKFSYENIDVYRVDMDFYKEKAETLLKNSLQNVKQSNNYVQGDINLDKSKVLVLSIPYNKGWRAYVDGEKQKILPANVTYMAIPLKAGNHHIVLRYETPYLKAGGVISLLAFLFLIGFIYYNKRHNILHERKK